MRRNAWVMLSIAMLGCGALRSGGTHAREVIAASVECADTYVTGDAGRYRARGCGLDQTFICDRDVAPSAGEIHCAEEGTSAAREIALNRWEHDAHARGPRDRLVTDSFGRTYQPTPQTSPTNPPPPPRRELPSSPTPY